MAWRPVSLGKSSPELGARGREIEKAVFREGRRQRIGITVIETEGVAMECVRNLDRSQASCAKSVLMGESI